MMGSSAGLRGARFVRGRQTYPNRPVQPMCGVQMGIDRALWEEWVKLVVLGTTVDAEV